MKSQTAKLAVVLACVLGYACSGGGKASAPAEGTPSSSEPAAAATSTASASGAGAALLSTVQFTDVSGNFAQQAITDLAALGVITPKTGAFNPNAPITRADFVTWLVKANNVYYKDTPAQQIRLAEGTRATFVDVPPSNPAFPYIQGLANAGYVIGVDATHFRPTGNLSREQMIGIKAARDAGGSNSKTDMSSMQIRLHFTDVAKIAPPYWGAVYDDFSASTSNNISRVYGTIKTFNPTAAVTRAEAAAALSVFSGEIPSESAAAALGQQ
jgi:hypothetical protein